MWLNNYKLAIQSIKSTKWRSFFTMLGIVIGVVGVVVVVSIGLGVKKQIIGQVNQMGPNLITIIPGQNYSRSSVGLGGKLNLVPSIGSGTLTERDWTLVSNTPGVGVAVPLSAITGSVSVGNNQTNNDLVIATTDSLPDVLNQNVEVGEFFTSDDNYNNVAVIGQNVAQKLFHDPAPIGQSFNIRGQTFTVDGVFSEFSTSPLSPISDYNNAIFIPFGVGAQMSGGNPQIYEILAKSTSVQNTNSVSGAIAKTLQNERGGQTDFTILQEKQDIALAISSLSVLTDLIIVVAVVSLIVGGVGIMNIMLVSVLERTREIGIRKAIGATDQQIFQQFLTESALIGLSGGILGIIIAAIIDVVIYFSTNLQPSINWETLLIAIGMGLVTGTLFGTMPAVRAARRDPIESLRHDF